MRNAPGKTQHCSVPAWQKKHQQQRKQPRQHTINVNGIHDELGILYNYDVCSIFHEERRCFSSLKTYSYYTVNLDVLLHRCHSSLFLSPDFLYIFLIDAISSSWIDEQCSAIAYSWLHKFYSLPFRDVSFLLYFISSPTFL